MIIWLASYPRSGNTFLRILLKHAFNLETYSVYGDVNDIAGDSTFAEIVGHKPLPENFDLDKARASSELFIIKTHDYPSTHPDKAIYLVRDGRECAVSYWHYLQSFISDSFSLNDVLYGDVRFGLWGDHIHQWDPINRPNTLVISFEDLVANPMSKIPSIATFIGVESNLGRIPDFSELNRINSQFFRKGEIDAWRKELSINQNLVFWLLNLKQMNEFYPAETPPAIFNNQDVKLVQSIMRQQGGLLVSKNKELQQKLFLSRSQLSVVRSQLSDTKKQLSSATKSIAQIRKVANELLSVKALWSPLAKYFRYKKLVAAIHEPLQNSRDDV
jgi:hypothetical protein